MHDFVETYPVVLYTQILSGMRYAGLHLCRFLGLSFEIPRTRTEADYYRVFHTKHTGSGGGGRHGYAVWTNAATCFTLWRMVAEMPACHVNVFT